MQGLEIVIIRHGETEWNCENRIQGQLDVPLNEKGIRQAQCTAKRLANEHFTHAYASDLSRAMVTARKIAPDAILHPTPALREWAFGDWQGKTVDEVQRLCPGGMLKFTRQDRAWRIPGGEGYDDVYARIKTFLEQLEKDHGNEKVLIVSHCGAIRTMFQYLIKGSVLTCPPEISNAAICRFRYKENGWQMICWNDTSHLTELGTMNGRY